MSSSAEDRLITRRAAVDRHDHTDTAAARIDLEEDVTNMGSYVDLDGVHTWYDEHGTGDPLVLLHPGGVDSRAFAPNLDALAGRFRAFTPERRGHGHFIPGQAAALSRGRCDVGQDARCRAPRPRRTRR
jgi:hypothetical protein